MSVKYAKLQDWAILPFKTLDSFTDNPCFTLQNPRTILLYPDTVNNIFLGFYMKMPYGFIFQVKKPFQHKSTWQILGDFMTPSILDNLQVSIQVITTCETYLYPGDILTHLQLYPICSISSFLKGKDIFQLCHFGPI
jgi:hypothetical protein